MAGFAAGILNVELAAVQVSIPHRLGAGVAVDAVQGIFTFRELGDGLVIVVETVHRIVRAGLEGHRSQIVIAAVVAGVTLGIGDGGGEFMDPALAAPIFFGSGGRIEQGGLGGRMTG